MRASRLLRLLLLLQNHGRLTSAQLAKELEVARRTILRDLDALTEAGLPVLVFQGQRGGIELGFNYRTRLTGLSADEAEALGVLLSRPAPELAELGMAAAAARACSKLLESLPDPVRERARLASRRFRFAADERTTTGDARISALAKAIREQRIVRIRAHSRDEHVIHPVSLEYGRRGWRVEDDLRPGKPIALASCGDINVSAKTFEPSRARHR